MVALFLGLVAGACTVPGPSSVWQRLSAHRSDYEDLAESWSKLPRGAYFCYFRGAWYDGGHDQYRWRDTYIEKVADGYLVTSPGARLTATTLAEATRNAGLAQEQVVSWQSSFERLSIQCMANSNGYVQLVLDGVGVPYGARYVPKDQAAMLNTLRRATPGALEPDDTQFVHLTDRWFYFRGRR